MKQIQFWAIAFSIALTIGTLTLLVGPQSAAQETATQETATQQTSAAAKDLAPAIDGVFDEWDGKYVLANDLPASSKNSVGVKSVSAIAYGPDLYIRLELDQVINLQGGNPEEPSLTLDFADAYKIDFGKRTIEVAGASGRKENWATFDFECLPTYASSVFELKISGWQNRPNPAAPCQFDLGVEHPGDFKVKPLRKNAFKQPEYLCPLENKTGIRIASQNTLQSGLSDAKRQKQLKRLLDATNADVFCFQEEREERSFKQGIAEVLPAAKNICWKNGCAIASQHKLTPLDMNLWRAAAALVETDKGNVVVISCHMKCCGYAGSEEDKIRVREANDMLEEIKKLRNGTFGDIAAKAPVVLIGDYNLVGSKEPLEIVHQAGLQDILCRSINGSACTWRGLSSSESYWPGRLDIASVNGFENATGYILDTERMPTQELKQRGLQKDDSRVSDHLTLVLDCQSK
jgi:endonuclease/exonuclease/phosphatase family metal-dependent hydrolase